MPGKITARLAELKIELPKAAAPVANYVPVVITGNQAFVSGQVTVWNGDLHRVKRCVKLNVFVNSAPGFTDQPKVANGASDFMVEVFGDAGKHARSAVGVAQLPLGVAVEVDATFE